MTYSGEAPSFTQYKPKIKQINFLNDIRNFIQQLKYKPYPMPKINEMLLILEVFQYDPYLDLNIGYYPIQLTEDASNLCTIIIPLGK